MLRQRNPADGRLAPTDHDQVGGASSSGLLVRVFEEDRDLPRHVPEEVADRLSRPAAVPAVAAGMGTVAR